MNHSVSLAKTLQFLDDLGRNNNRPWFEQHRPDYESAKSDYEHFLDGLIDEFRIPDQLGSLSARDCTARIFRDIRFSKDKTPYKTNLAAVIGPGGWKGSQFGYYLSIEPHDRSMAAGGMHEPSSAQLDRFRQSIARNANGFKRIIQSPDFVSTFGELDDDRLKTAPKGYDRDHPEISLLKLKQVTVIHRFADQEVLAADFHARVIAVCRTMRPFLDYLQEVAE